MNKKGFTIIELLAVIVILGILSSLALVGVSRYREEVKKRELINLHSTIDAWYDTYRADLLVKGESPEQILTLDEAIDAGLDIAYNGERITKENARGRIELNIKGDLLNMSYYTTGKTEADFIKDGACAIKTEKEGDQLKKSCIGTAPNYTASKEEILCITLENEYETLINDIDDTTNLCNYWRK